MPTLKLPPPSIDVIETLIVRNDTEALAEHINSENAPAIRNMDVVTLAAKHNAELALKLFLENHFPADGLKPDRFTLRHKATPLEQAIIHENLDCARLLLDHGAAIDATQFARALSESRHAAVMLLLDYAPASNNFGTEVLMHALACYDTAVRDLVKSVEQHADAATAAAAAVPAIDNLHAHIDMIERMRQRGFRFPYPNDKDAREWCWSLTHSEVRVRKALDAEPKEIKITTRSRSSHALHPVRQALGNCRSGLAGHDAVY